MNPDRRRRSEGGNEPTRTGEFAASRRIALNTAVRVAGEIVAKAANVVMFVAIARELGESQFGDFIFGLSLSLVVLGAAGFGSDELIARNVSRGRNLVHHMLVNVLALRALMLLGLLGVVIGVAALGDYSQEALVAIGLIAIGVGIEIMTGSLQAVFQGYERMQYTSITLIVQRFTTTVLALTVLALGGGLVAVGAVFALGSAIGFLTAVGLLRWRVTRVRLRVDRRLWGAIVRGAAPLGLAVLLFTALLKLDATLLGLLTTSSEVGSYGAAYRLVEATMFLTWSIGGAMLPWFSRQEEGAPVPLFRGYELGLKAISAALIPIGIVYVMLAEPLIDLIYGQQYANAVGPLRLLGAMTVLFGMNSYASLVLIARNRPGDFVRPAALIVAQNVIFNLILIPRYGAEGAAFNAVLSGALLATASTWIAGRRRVIGPYSLTRALLGPLAAGGVMAAVIGLGGATLPVAVLGLAAFVATFATIERYAFSEDFELYANVLSRLRARGGAARFSAPAELEIGR